MLHAAYEPAFDLDHALAQARLMTGVTTPVRISPNRRKEMR